MSKIYKKIKGEKDLIFEDFIEEKVLSGLSQNTIMDYKVSYKRFVFDTGGKISKKSIDGWIQNLIDKKMNPISINFYISHVRAYAYWLMKNGHLERFEIKKLKNQEPQLRTISDEEIKTLIKRPSSKCSYVDYRSWLIINFIMGTGARASTVVNVKIEDIDFDNKEIRYSHLKNKSSAIVPLSTALEKAIKHFLTVWSIGYEFLFPDRFGGKLTITALEQSLRKYCEKRGVRYRGAHAFRHTFAKKYVVNGGNAFSLQKILTHTDLTMTKKYVHLFSSDLKRDFEHVCPLDNYHKKSVVVSRK